MEREEKKHYMFKGHWGGLMGLVSKGPRKPCFCVFTYTVSHCEKPNVQTQPPSRNMPLETKSNEEGLDGAEETLESSEYDLGRILLQHFSLLKSENNREPSPTFISIVLMNIIRKKKRDFSASATHYTCRTIQRDHAALEVIRRKEPLIHVPVEWVCWGPAELFPWPSW